MYNFGGTKLSGKVSLGVWGEKRLNTTGLYHHHHHHRHHHHHLVLGHSAACSGSNYRNGLHYFHYECISKIFRTESITKYTFTTINTRWEATQRVMALILTRLTHKIAIKLHLVAESYTTCISRFRRPVWELLDTPSSTLVYSISYLAYVTRRIPLHL
jgi:hypothetical protein